MLSRTTPLAGALLGAALLAGTLGCSATDSATTGSADSTPGSRPAGTTGTTAVAGFTPVSDVDAHVAIGDDVLAIKKEIGTAKNGEPVAWDAVRATFTEGGASKKGDGTMRTLQTLVDEPEIVAHVTAAIDGTGTGDADDKVRAQMVEKGISALLRAKILDELVAAEMKIGEGTTDPASGAPHNVDEAWAFYYASDDGVQVTAQKRGDDFDVDLDGPILTALARAQTAAVAGDAAAFDAAEDDVRGWLNAVFYLATYKYLDTGGDDVKQAEGESFYLAISGMVADAAPGADAAIRAAFTADDATAGRAALNRPPVIAALEVPAEVVQP